MIWTYHILIITGNIQSHIQVTQHRRRVGAIVQVFSHSHLRCDTGCYLKSTRPGERTFCHGKSPFWNGHINYFDWAMFNSYYMLVYQRAICIEIFWLSCDLFWHLNRAPKGFQHVPTWVRRVFNQFISYGDIMSLLIRAYIYIYIIIP